MGFLGTEANQFADITLIAQAAGYLLLILGVVFAKKSNLKQHIRLTQFAVMLGLISFLWMSYSLLLGYQSFLFSLGLPAVIHIVIGILALSSGILFVLNKFIKKTRTNMRTVFLLWTFAWTMGVILYYSLYYNI